MSMATIKTKLLRNLGANAYGQLITVAIQLISVPLFLHYWGVKLYGEWLILSTIPAYLSLSDIGFASVAANDMTMRVAKGDKKGALEVYQSIWIFISVVSVIVTCVFSISIYVFPLNDIFSISYISGKHTQQVLIILMLSVLLGLQGGVLNTAFRAVGRYAYGAILNNTVRLLEWFFSIVALLLGGDVLVVALVMLLVKLSGFIVIWVILRRQVAWLILGMKEASTQKIRELIKPAIAFMAFPLGLALSIQGLVLVIGIFLGPVAVALFSAYRTLTRLLVQIVTMLNQAIWPEVSAAYGVGKMDLVKQLHYKASSLIFWMALSSVTVLGLIGEFIINVWTRNAFEINHFLLGLLLVTAFVNVLWQSSWVVLMATNKHQKISVAFVIASAIGLVISFLLIPYMGVNGAGVALLLAELPMFYFAVNNGLILLGDNWLAYIKEVIRNPFQHMVVR